MAEEPKITPENWQEKYEQGFRWKENLADYSQHKVSAGEWLLNHYYQPFGYNNVLTGAPASEQGVPDNSVPGLEDALGIYVRTKETTPQGQYTRLTDQFRASAKFAFVKDGYVYGSTGFSMHKGLRDLKMYIAYSLSDLQSIELTDGELILKDSFDGEVHFSGTPKELQALKALLPTV